ncbi:hypothetical protein BO79DRAFT_52137 [Aspergillus costaricaensis CBS 115574]|uniref:Uncharacterized protein n=1 Tax=Aspergillus costaricaensis CBS 115574 TaxID=1448317 RepID=A0ACD1I4K0_9EURO|nr:hypothetical protein BO79DRAFT_52137 [Aspergillus costaricaensis CBS 115574]RAK84679.1 hypothetical protein BO79DRAFT_52137 [Aspergillus costaricaensis CBS 115574]
MQQKELTNARQQIEMLGRSLDGQVMRFLPKGVKWSISLRDRADVARVFVALVKHWLSKTGGEEALTSWGTIRQLASAEKPAKIAEAE